MFVNNLLTDVHSEEKQEEVSKYSKEHKWIHENGIEFQRIFEVNCRKGQSEGNHKILLPFSTVHRAVTKICWEIQKTESTDWKNYNLRLLKSKKQNSVDQVYAEDQPPCSISLTTQVESSTKRTTDVNLRFNPVRVRVKLSLKAIHLILLSKKSHFTLLTLQHMMEYNQKLWRFSCFSSTQKCKLDSSGKGWMKRFQGWPFKL